MAEVIGKARLKQETAKIQVSIQEKGLGSEDHCMTGFITNK